MTIRTLVIPAAGMGTRFLPATKSVPKELFPILNRPAIHYIVEEAVASGVERVILVTSPAKAALAEYFAPRPDLESFLEKTGRTELRKEIREPFRGAEIVTVYQEQALGLGHAVLTARKAVGNEPFAVALPDDLIRAGTPCLRQMIEAAAGAGIPMVALMEVSEAELSRYGIVEPADEKDDRPCLALRGVVEKPSPASAPSRLAVIGRYLLPPDIFPVLERIPPGRGGEIQLTDALMSLARSRTLYGWRFRGTRYDLGTPEGFLEASMLLALEDPGLRPVVDRFRGGGGGAT